MGGNDAGVPRGGGGRQGRGAWACGSRRVGCKAALWDPWFSNWEQRWREVRTKALEGGGALQAWGLPGPPVRCNRTPLTCLRRGMLS